MYFLAAATLVSVGFIRNREMENNTFPDWGLPTAHPKEEDTEEWPGATAAQPHPATVGGATKSAAADQHLAARMPKFSGLTPLEPYLAQFKIVA